MGERSSICFARASYAERDSGTTQTAHEPETLTTRTIADDRREGASTGALATASPVAAKAKCFRQMSPYPRAPSSSSDPVPPEETPSHISRTNRYARYEVAQDILHVGPIGLGWLQAASSLGAVCMALTLAQRPPFKRAGRALLLAVSGFGVATIIFGLSHWFWLSSLMLILLGAFDNISVVIRSTLLLVRTPDAMRGRVSAVSSLFIGTSNQLGGFESGLTGQLFGPVPAVALGGIGTLLVVTLVAMCWPEIRRLGTLRGGAVEN